MRLEHYMKKHLCERHDLDRAELVQHAPFRFLAALGHVPRLGYSSGRAPFWVVLRSRPGTRRLGFFWWLLGVRVNLERAAWVPGSSRVWKQTWNVPFGFVAALRREEEFGSRRLGSWQPSGCEGRLGSWQFSGVEERTWIVPPGFLAARGRGGGLGSRCLGSWQHFGVEAGLDRAAWLLGIS